MVLVRRKLFAGIKLPAAGVALLFTAVAAAWTVAEFILSLAAATKAGVVLLLTAAAAAGTAVFCISVERFTAGPITSFKIDHKLMFATFITPPPRSYLATT